jgi:hypothetical protein
MIIMKDANNASKVAWLKKMPLTVPQLALVCGRVGTDFDENKDRNKF